MLKKIRATILLLITIIGCMTITQVSNMTAQAAEGCPIVSIAIDKNLVSTGETITITVKMKDENVAEYFSVNMPDSTQTMLVSLAESSDGIFTGTFKVTESTKPGLWQIKYFGYRTKYSEWKYVYNNDLYNYSWVDFLYDFSPLDFEVVEIDDSATGTAQDNYIVVFKDGNGNTLSTQRVAHGEAATAPSAPTAEDFIFDGWDKDFSVVTSNLTVNAKRKLDPSGPYDKEVYVGERMTFEVTTSTSQSFAITCNDKSLEINSDYKRTGSSSVSIGGYTKYSYTYSCYATINTPGVYMIYIKGSAASNTLSYKVKVSESPEYTVKYDANGGTGTPSAQIKTHGQTLTLSNTKPTKSHTITYNANGGSVSPESKTVSATFSSWNTSANGNGTSYNAGASYTADKATTLYAQWINPTVGTLPTPTKEGYTFDGWYTAESGGTKVTDSSTVSKDTTLYAQWCNSITYNANGRECAVNSRFPQNQVKKYNENIAISSNRPYCTWTAYDSHDVITCCGATFAGWNTKKDGTGISFKPGDTYSLNENLVLYAQWEFSIRYDTNLGVDSPIPPDTQIKKQGQSVVISSDVPEIKIVTGIHENERKVYRFIGWRSSDNKYFYNPGDIHTDDTSLYLYAQWESADFTTNRLAGNSRTETAVKISTASFTKATNVVIASGDDYADALAGVPLAYALDAPILLVRNHNLDADTLAEIKRLGAKNIYILGGEFAVNAKVAKTLTNKGYNVTRIAGQDRFGTSLEIAKKLQSVAGKPSEIIFVYSHNYPDALAVSGVAAAKKCPVIYIAGTGKLTNGIANFVKSSGAEKATIISGPAIVNNAAEGNIKKAGISNVNRIYGANRYETCIMINEAYASTLTGNAICVATGTNFPDALAGGVFAAKNNAPMVLVGKELTADQESYIDSLVIDTAYIFGGTGAVSEEVEYDIFN